VLFYELPIDKDYPAVSGVRLITRRYGGGCHVQGRVVGRHCNLSFLADQGEFLDEKVTAGVVDGD
jgi:hypothetical protein